MASFTLAQAQENLERATQAYQNALSGKGYTRMNGGSSMTMQRQEILTLKSEMIYWQNMVNDLSGVTSNRQKVAIPRDIR